MVRSSASRAPSTCTTARVSTPGPTPRPLRHDHPHRPDVVAAGVMRLTATDFARQLSTMRVSGVVGPLERARWLAQFSTRFLRSLGSVYGGPLDGVGEFPAAPPVPVPPTGDGTRRLRLPAAEPRWCDGDGCWHEGNEVGDDAWLRLTRYEGGRRGPCCSLPALACRPCRSSAAPSTPTSPSTRSQGLRRLAVRLPGGHRPALVANVVHARRHRHRGLARGGGRGAAGDRGVQRAGGGALRGIGVVDDGAGLRRSPTCAPRSACSSRSIPRRRCSIEPRPRWGSGPCSVSWA